MWKTLRLLALLAGIVSILMSDEGISISSSDFSFMVISIAILIGLLFATISGWSSIMSKRKAPYLIRLSLSTSPFDKRAVLQFQHFAYYFFILLGTAGVIRNWSVTNYWGLVEIPAFGVGLFFGTAMLLRVYRGRFKNPQTEQDAPSNGGQRSSLNSGFLPRRG